MRQCVINKQESCNGFVKDDFSCTKTLKIFHLDEKSNLHQVAISAGRAGIILLTL